MLSSIIVKYNCLFFIVYWFKFVVYEISLTMTQTKTEPTANDSSPNRQDQDGVTEEEVSIGSIAAIPERQYSSTDSMSCRICQSATDKSR